MWCRVQIVTICGVGYNVRHFDGHIKSGFTTSNRPEEKKKIVIHVNNGGNALYQQAQSHTLGGHVGTESLS